MHQKGSYLIVGGDSLIGSALSAHLSLNKRNVVSTTRSSRRVIKNQIFLDLTNQVIPPLEKFSCAFLCAGITNLSSCEKDPHQTSQVNVDHTIKLAEQLLSSGCRVVFISSNTVFDGTIKNPNEDTPYSYLTEYGRQKAEAECKLLALGKGAIVARITKVVSFKLPIFSSILNKLKQGLDCEVFEDLFICPISLDYVCESFLRIAESSEEGIFHISGESDLSYAGFAYKMVEALNLNPNLVRPTHSKNVLFKPQYADLGMKKTTPLLNLFPEPSDLFFSRLLK